MNICKNVPEIEKCMFKNIKNIISPLNQAAKIDSENKTNINMFDMNIIIKSCLSVYP